MPSPLQLDGEVISRPVLNGLHHVSISESADLDRLMPPFPTSSPGLTHKVDRRIGADVGICAFNHGCQRMAVDGLASGRRTMFRGRSSLRSRCNAQSLACSGVS